MRNLLISLMLILGLTLAACGRGSGGASETPAVQEQAPAQEASATDEQAEADAAPAEGEAAEGVVTLPEVNPLEVSGDIVVAGSSTVYPLTEAMAERFVDEGYSGNITIDSIGSGAGFERFCVAGESDISNASRPINEEEIANCQSIGREPLEIRVGTDALAIVVNPANDWVDDLTIEQLAMIFSADVTNWSEVDPNWPDVPILRFSPGTDSGTFDYFIEAVMAETYGEEEGEVKLLDAINLQLSEDDNVLVQGVEGDVNAIGYFGYAYYEENAGALKVLNINGVTPSAETVGDASYVLARPLLIYTAPSVLAEKPQVASFINFYLSYVDEEVVDVGYFPASEEELNEAKQAWLDAVGQ